jgi:spore germination protein YaaH
MKCPGTEIYPWIGRVVRSPRVFESKHFLNRLIEFVNTHNLPGLHLDAEPPFGSSGFKYLPQYIYFLKVFKRELVKDGKKLSIALFPAMVKDFYEKNQSKKADLSILADSVDQFVLMMYDTGLDDKEKFLHHMVSHIAFFNGLKENKANKEIIIGAASYGWHANRKYRWIHDPGVENIETTIGLLKEYLKKNRGKIRIDGYALFRYGTTDPLEWEQFLDILNI